MSAYLLTFIYGNESYGGYFSVDGSERMVFEDDMTYPIDPGRHRIDIFTDARRGVGEEWNIDVDLRDGQLLTVSVQSEGQRLVEVPRFKVEDLDQETLTRLQNLFRERDLQAEMDRQMQAQAREEERARQASMPRRRPGHIVWGAILMFFGFCGCLGAMGGMVGGEFSVEMIAVPVIFIGMGVLGLCLFINGMKKKIR